MAEASKENSTQRKCPQCGAELPDHVSSELCPKCLLKAGMGTQPRPGPEAAAALPVVKTKSHGQPQPGDRFGHYRILRLLGEGGMGAAFDAEDLESGRRVALKVLSHTLDSPEARERFFREGRLAASINHPNSVYVFGTEEIAGTPVIAMELVAGGTLQDLVRAKGPMPVGEAVDAVLQMIAGLEAAQRVGILHRDVKPSNCFRDIEGMVKIGDFGLSISTAVRIEPALTAAGEFLGTPAFCSPEQLRGDELNARSDMYSVGATLFYLLTGRTPFEAKNVVQLLAIVLEQHAPSPRKLRPDIPPALAGIILRCLEKQPGERFKDYQDLTRALTPYGSAAPTPATLGFRFLAGACDSLVLGFVFMGLMLPVFGDWEDFLNLANASSPKVRALMLISFSVMILYFALLEGNWGVSLGKLICRLRVVRPDKNPPGFGRALLRAMIYVGLPVLPYWLIYGGNFKVYLSSSMGAQYAMSASYYALLALLFCTARRRNGFAALQDLASNTRVISRTALQLRPILSAIERPPPAVESKTTVGPYHVLETLGKTAGSEWLLGYDLRLLRKVWIRKVPEVTTAVPATLRNISRVGRLRWLAGRRTPEENWDAFEAASGRALVELICRPQPWSQVRFWLHDLSAEITAAGKDGTLPVLALDRVWITAEGRAKLLDFVAPGLAGAGLGSAVELSSLPGSNSDASSLQGGTSSEFQPCKMPPREFLSAVAAASLAGRKQIKPNSVGEVPVPLPLHARAFLKVLPQTHDVQTVLSTLKPLLTRVAEISRLRRAAVVAGCLAFPLLAAFGMFFGVTFMERWERSNPGLMELNHLLQVRNGMRLWPKKAKGPTDRQFAIYIASHYRSVVTNETTWSGVFTLAMIKGEGRRFAETSVAEDSAPTEAELAEAERAVGSLIPKHGMFAQLKQPRFALMMLSTTLAIYVGIPALIAALVFRGGLVLLIAGMTFVRRDGARASRLRMFWRGLVAWGSPVLVVIVTWLLLCAVYGFKPKFDSHLATYGWGITSALLICALTIVSVALPKRSLPDRLAGTWPVPR